jgi:hypothetical protein
MEEPWVEAFTFVIHKDGKEDILATSRIRYFGQNQNDSEWD